MRQDDFNVSSIKTAITSDDFRSLRDPLLACFKSRDWIIKEIFNRTHTAVNTRHINITAPLSTLLQCTAVSRKASLSGHVGLHKAPRQVSITFTGWSRVFAHFRRVDCKVMLLFSRRIAVDNHVPCFLEVLWCKFETKKLYELSKVPVKWSSIFVKQSVGRICFTV